ncbi:MAG: DUF6206 family protein [Candidatus Micrarchaeota archaeon]
MAEGNPKRELKELGTGAFNTALEIHGGSLHGTVLKRINKISLRRDEYAELKDCHDRYAQLLREAGIDLVPAQMNHAGNGEKVRPYLMQSRIDNEKIVSNVLKAGSTEAALGAFNNLAQILISADKRRGGMQLKPFLDGTPSNYVLEGDKIKLFDHFPPMFTEKNELYPLAILKIYHQRQRAVVGKPQLYFSMRSEAPSAIRTELHEALGHIFDLSFPLAALLYYAAQLRPKLVTQFQSRIKDILDREHGSKKADEILFNALAQVTRWSRRSEP